MGDTSINLSDFMNRPVVQKTVPDESVKKEEPKKEEEVKVEEPKKEEPKKEVKPKIDPSIKKDVNNILSNLLEDEVIKEQYEMFPTTESVTGQKLIGDDTMKLYKEGMESSINDVISVFSTVDKAIKSGKITVVESNNASNSDVHYDTPIIDPVYDEHDDMLIDDSSNLSVFRDDEDEQTDEPITQIEDEVVTIDTVTVEKTDEHVLTEDIDLLKLDTLSNTQTRKFNKRKRKFSDKVKSLKKRGRYSEMYLPNSNQVVRTYEFTSSFELNLIKQAAKIASLSLLDLDYDLLKKIYEHTEIICSDGDDITFKEFVNGISDTDFELLQLNCILANNMKETSVSVTCGECETDNDDIKINLVEYAKQMLKPYISQYDEKWNADSTFNELKKAIGFTDAHSVSIKDSDGDIIRVIISKNTIAKKFAIERKIANSILKEHAHLVPEIYKHKDMKTKMAIITAIDTNIVTEATYDISSLARVDMLQLISVDEDGKEHIMDEVNIIESSFEELIDIQESIPDELLEKIIKKSFYDKEEELQNNTQMSTTCIKCKTNIEFGVDLDNLLFMLVLEKTG